MKICVCFKIVPDLEQILLRDWENINNDLDTSYVKKTYNCFDESALEMALRLKDSFNQTINITAVTIGNENSSLIKNLYAVGYDHVTEIKVKNSDFCSRKIALLLSEYIKKEKFDLVLTGKQAGMADSGTVPFVLSEILGWPLLTNIVDIDICDNELVFVSNDDEIFETIKINGSALLSVGDAKCPYLRMASLREKMKASKKEVEILNEDNIKLDDKIVFYNKKPVKKCIFIEGESLEDKINILYQEFIKERID